MATKRCAECGTPVGPDDNLCAACEDFHNGVPVLTDEDDLFDESDALFEEDETFDPDDDDFDDFDDDEA